jgi:5'-deoxynucleotidase YfbR-like HD superfamily hydrolase
MHDAAEAYIHDLASPLKEAIGNLYKMYEDEFLVKIFRRFGVGNSSVLPDVVKSYDKDLTIHELRSLLYSNFYQNPVFASVRNLDIVPFTPVQAKRAFLTRYWEVLNIVSR